MKRACPRHLSLLLLLFGGVLWITPTFAADRPNVLLICVDDLRPELASFGVSTVRSPNMDSIAATGRAFHRHYVQAPTCGASRFTLLTGRYGPAGNGALFQRAKQLAGTPESVSPSLPAWFRTHGYTTVSVGKVSHHPGGRGGPDWDDDDIPEMPLSWDRHLMPVGPWRHPRGAMHGLAHGEIRVKAGEMDVFQSATGPDTIYPDGLTIETALEQMDHLAANRRRNGTPFFLAVGIIRPHLPFGAPAGYLDPYRDTVFPPIPHPGKPPGKTTWHGSGEFMKYNRWTRDPNRDAAFAQEIRRHYAACVTYADALVGRLMARLESLDRTNDTIVVVWGDHGWHLGEHAIWGKHALFEESLRSPLILRYPGIKKPGTATRAIVETVDIFPTLCDLAGLKRPEGLDGRSLLPQLQSPDAAGHTAISYTSRARTIRTDTHRLIEHGDGDGDGHLELYDHSTPEGETKNLAADRPELAAALRLQLKSRLGTGR